MRFKLSVVVGDLFGASGLRILHAIVRERQMLRVSSNSVTERLHCPRERPIEAVPGRSHPTHRQMLALQLERLRLLEEQPDSLNALLAQAMRAIGTPCFVWHRSRCRNRFGTTGDRDVGVTAASFPSAAEFTCWVGRCPGKEESAEENRSGRSVKGKVHAPSSQLGSSRCRQKQRNPFPSCISFVFCYD